MTIRSTWHPPKKKTLQGGDIRAIKVIKKPSNSEGLQTVSNEAGGEVDDL